MDERERRRQLVRQEMSGTGWWLVGLLLSLAGAGVGLAVGAYIGVALGGLAFLVAIFVGPVIGFFVGRWLGLELWARSG